MGYASHFGSISENAEMTLDLDFLADSQISLGCRSGSPFAPLFNINSHGDWDIMSGPGGNGNYASINPDRNQFTLRCLGSQVTLIANGELVKTVELPDIAPQAGMMVFNVGPNSRVSPKKITLNILQSSSLPQPTTLPNRAVLPPEYAPGEEIYQTDFVDWRPNWKFAFAAAGSFKPEQGFVMESQKFPITLLYRPEIGDTEVEIGANVVFGKSGYLGLTCRFTPLGRYEFLIQQDGTWLIRRDTADFEPRLTNYTTLAQGKSIAIQSDQNELTAICQGNELIFSANGEELGRVHDDLYPEGLVGIFFDSYTAGSFTNLTMRRAQ
jgi:hypothetical protein